jgi:hypothetical protein
MTDEVNDASDTPAGRVSESQLLEIALKMAANADEGSPTLIQYSEGDRVHANLVASGARIFEHRPTYLIAIRGQFTYWTAKRPPGQPPPEGTVMTLVVDAETGRLYDVGIHTMYPRLEELGPVMTALP